MKYKAKLLLFFTAVSTLFVNGCSLPRPQGEKLAARCSAPINTYSYSNSAKGKTIKYIKLGEGYNTTLLIASIHGDEQAGTSLLNQFRRYLKKNRNLLCDKTVIIAPIINPDGFAGKTRLNANHIDINRNFPSDNRINDPNSGSFALSESESWGLYKIINTYKPAKVLTFHESLGCIDYDGPAGKIAGRLAAKCKLPVRKLGARPGSLGSYVGLTINTPIITIELTDEDSKKTTKKLWNDYKDMLIEAVSL
jgi:protein MpaA